MELRGKVAIVTGASDGIGLATALALARAGCRVAICGREAARLDAAAAAIREAAGGPAAQPTDGGAVIALAGDVADRCFAHRLVGATVDAFGTVDILVNNAGIGLVAPIQHLRAEDLRRVFDVNFYGALWLIQAVLPAMRMQRSGAIVNVASIVVDAGPPGIGGYTATKGALVALSRSLRAEVRREGIAVSIVHPGVTRTQFDTRSIVRSAEYAVPVRPSLPRRAVRWLIRRTVYGRTVSLVVEPERVADAIIDAIRHRRREVYATKRDKLVVTLLRLLGPLSDRLLALRRAI